MKAKTQSATGLDACRGRCDPIARALLLLFIALLWCLASNTWAATLLDAHFGLDEEGFVYSDDTFNGSTEPDGQVNSSVGAGTAIDFVFTPGNWDDVRTVVITSVDDAVNDNIAEAIHTTTIVQSAASVDPNYDGLDLSGDDMTATITDNESVGVTIVESDGATSVIETGATDTYLVSLDSEPTDDVVITIDPDEETDLGSGVDTPIILTFTSADWFVAQLVVVRAFDDAIDEGGHTSTITHTAARVPLLVSTNLFKVSFVTPFQERSYVDQALIVKYGTKALDFVKKSTYIVHVVSVAWASGSPIWIRVQAGIRGQAFRSAPLWPH